jgi:DNA-binding NarL/FixJ family response regulator
MSSTFNILLADDHSLVRGGIRSLLERLPGVKIVAEVSGGREAVEAVQAGALHLVVMDIAMPGLNGLDAAARIRREYPDVKVLMLSMHAGESYVLQALRAGAAGYLLKDAATTELTLAVAAIRRGETYLSSSLSRESIMRQLEAAHSRTEIIKSLSPRMREILQLIAEGRSSKEIAALLSLSIKTVDTHRMHLMARLDIHDIAGLVRYAVREGMISPDT